MALSYPCLIYYEEVRLLSGQIHHMENGSRYSVLEATWVRCVHGPRWLVAAQNVVLTPGATDSAITAAQASPNKAGTEFQ